MLKKLMIAAVMVPFFASMLPAEINFDNGSKVSIADGISSMKISVPAPEKTGTRETPLKEWTIMVFVNAKNNLEQFGLKDMNEMEMVGSNNNLNIVVELSRMEGFDASDGDWKGSRRYLVQKDNDPRKITSPVVQDIGKVDMGDWKHLVDFGRWAKTNYPAKKYMLIVWNHGAGWVKSHAMQVDRGISYDDETNNHINTPQLEWALKAIGGVSVLGTDACLMQMAEVVYQLKDGAEYIVGSEETEPGDGYTYNDFLAPVAANPAMSPYDVAKIAVDAYSNHYGQIGEGSTQSFVKASAADGLLKAVNEFSYAFSQSNDKALAKKAMGMTQSYAYPENKDLYHFAQLVVAETKDQNVKQKGLFLMDYITKALVMHNRTTGSSGSGGWWAPPTDYSNSHGIAIYLPGRTPATGYNLLHWSRYSNWDEFLAWVAAP